MRSTAGIRVLIIAAIGLVACGGDDVSTTSSVDRDGTAIAGQGSDDGGGFAGTADDSDLLVARSYLQGEWCDSDGGMWTIEGDMARYEDGSGGVAEIPVDIAFIDGLDESLVSQTDDEFVVGSEFGEMTFTRGGC